jgi:hypothetical protein
MRVTVGEVNRQDINTDISDNERPNEGASIIKINVYKKEQIL